MTQQDLSQIKTLLQENNKNLVTKDDLSRALEENNKNLVTKDDLSRALEENNKNLVTKDDLIENNKNLVTKDDLIENNKNLVTKDDLSENNKRLAKIFATKQDLEKLVTKDEYHKTVDQILTSLDGIYGIVKRWDDERFMLSTKIKNHETRITKVEKQVFAN